MLVRHNLNMTAAAPSLRSVWLPYLGGALPLPCLVGLSGPWSRLCSDSHSLQLSVFITNVTLSWGQCGQLPHWKGCLCGALWVVWWLALVSTGKPGVFCRCRAVTLMSKTRLRNAGNHWNHVKSEWQGCINVWYEYSAVWSTASCWMLRLCISRFDVMYVNMMK